MLDRLIDRVRGGESRALVLRGEPGVGKTALLDYLVEQACGCRVVRAAGVQSEMELAFAGLHQLLAPLLDRVELLPAPQCGALTTAFGLSSGSAPDRFFVALAVLSLLSEVAEQQPPICVVDDVQWLDRASAQALGFVARRLEAESVGLVFAVRGSSDELAGLPELVVEGLSEGDAHALLGSALTGPLDEQVRDRIVGEARGNPLALLELPRSMTPAELAGGFALPGAVALEGRIEESFQRRLDALPPNTRRLMQIAAADPVGEPPLLWRAAQRLAIETDDVTPGVEAGLIEFGATVRFRHPLVRSAVYRSASLQERQDVHRALAEATDRELDPDRRAWHLAQATPGTDEEVAAELERSAGRARARGGLAAAAAFLERAVGLTPDPARRALRALAAAQAKHLAGAPDVGLRLLAAAEAGPLDELGRARVELLRAQITFASSRCSDAPSLLLRAAKRLQSLDLGLARTTYLDALSAAIFVGRLAGGAGVVEVAKAALVAPQPHPPCPSDLLLDGLATRFRDGYAAGAPMLKQALGAPSRNLSSEEALRWMWLAAFAAADLWDDQMWEVLATRNVQLARETGVLTELPFALNHRSGAHAFAGELATAASLIGEARAVNEAIGSHFPPYGALLRAAWRGREAEATRLIEATRNEVLARGEAYGLSLAAWASAVLYNGLGRYEDALAAAERASEHPEDLAISNWGVAELIEAAFRSGNAERAADALERLTEMTRASGTDWALGIEARSRALLSNDDAADALYREAIEHLARTRIRVELARAHLLYGEWLRRERRRTDAREQLRTAHDMLDKMGLEAFAERARRELAATGETARKRTVETRDELTAQEAQIARLARDGLSNPEIGARLFISPGTVKYHLHKIFIKLDIHSRIELDHVLPRDATAVPRL